MKVVLIQNVPGLGKIDDIKEVSEGYARNFLFAKNVAMPATDKMLAEVGARQVKKVKNSESELLEQQALAQRLDGWEINIKEKTSASGGLYAAVNAQKIIDALAKSGFKIDKSQVLMKPIKEIGQHSAKIKFSHGLESEIHITISKV
jgi:large subunit ribosomal protein L9